jgi:hypothetical protein
MKFPRYSIKKIQESIQNFKLAENFSNSSQRHFQKLDEHLAG